MVSSEWSKFTIDHSPFIRWLLKAEKVQGSDITMLSKEQKLIRKKLQNLKSF